MPGTSGARQLGCCRRQSGSKTRRQRKQRGRTAAEDTERTFKPPEGLGGGPALPRACLGPACASLGQQRLTEQQEQQEQQQGAQAGAAARPLSLSLPAWSAAGFNCRAGFQASAPSQALGACLMEPLLSFGFDAHLPEPHPSEPGTLPSISLLLSALRRRDQNPS